MDYDKVACMAVFKAICRETVDKYWAWFREHPGEPYCYWSADEPIAIRDKDNEELLAKHPEIEDIDDHTTVRPDGDSLVFKDFCPKLRRAVGAYMKGKDQHLMTIDGVRVVTVPDGDNFKITATYA